MIEALVDTARERGLETVRLHAQTHAIRLYEKCGFRPVGKEFLEAGIRHVDMTRGTASGR
jgi:predicted GNAT family N-acyltransferase